MSKEDLQSYFGINYQNAEDCLKTLEGKILTVIDATIGETAPNKATKDLIRSEMCKTRNDFWKFNIGEYKQGHSKIN